MSKNNISDYYEGLQRVIKRFTECWQQGEGRFEVTISDDKGEAEWSIKGGPTERSKKLKGSDDE